MASLSFVNNFASFPVGAIVGDTPNPYCATGVATAVAGPGTSGYLTSGALNVGDPGDLGNETGATVELWFRHTATPAAQRDVMIGPEVAVGVTQWKLQLNTNNTITFFVRRSGANVSVTSTTATLNNVWYYVVGAVDDTANLVKIYVNGVQDASTAWTAGSAIDPMATGTRLDLRLGDASDDIEQHFDEVAIHRRFIGVNRISAHYTAGTQRGWATGLSGARMIDILDDSTSHAAPRSLQAGQRNVTESYSAGQPPLTELQKARDADNVDALLFVSAGGTITYLDAAHRSASPYNTIQATFGDAGGSELPYEDLDVEYADSFIVNEWDVTRSAGRKESFINPDDGTTQTASDPTSIKRYFKRSQSLGDVPVVTDTDAAAVATALLAKTKDPMFRITSLQLSTLDPAVAEAVFRREIGDKIRVLRTPPGGGSRISQDLFIQKIEIAASNDGSPWSVRWGVSPL